MPVTQIAIEWNYLILKWNFTQKDSTGNLNKWNEAIPFYHEEHIILNLGGK